MSIVVDGSGTAYRPYFYQNEKEFEAYVIQLADQLFGASSLYVDVKKRVKGNDVISIPDGYVIDVTEPDDPNLFIVENEISAHDPFKHIGVQLLRFVTSVEGAQKELRDILMQEITSNTVLLEKLQAATDASTSRNIDNYLDRAVYGPFHGVVIIDDAGPELHNVLKHIRANISVLKLQTFVSDDGTRLHYFDTLYDEETDTVVAAALEEKGREAPAELQAARRRRRAMSDTIVVPAREEGFKRVFLGQNRWYSIRIGAAMKDRIKYIAAYQIAPISAVTHVAEVQEIRLYQDSGKYEVVFAGPAAEVRPVPIRDPKNSPQGPVYVRKEDLLNADHLEDALTAGFPKRLLD